jgi:DNA polymerase V
LKQIYRSGYAYQKAGVMLSELQPRAMLQASLFSDTAANVCASRLMATMDSLNEKYGRNTLRVAAQGDGTRWRMKRERVSPGYTTDWAGLPVVLAR